MQKNRADTLHLNSVSALLYGDGKRRTECVQHLLSNATARKMWVHLRVHIHMGSQK